MEKYKKADLLLEDNIISAMAESFNEPQNIIRFFFEEKRLSTDTCYVCIKEDKLVSLVNILDLEIQIENNILKGAYVYGVCTLKEYRNHGYMSNLLRYVNSVCLKKGYDCLFLSPASVELKMFYERLGYKEFFINRRIELDNTQMKNLGDINSYSFEDDSNLSLSLDEICNLRYDVYKNSNAVSYSKKDIEFAEKLYGTFNGGKIVSAEFGYSICVPLPNENLKIIDLTCKKYPDTKKLLQKIYTIFPNKQKYIIETSAKNSFFENTGNTYYTGMLLPLTKCCEELVNKTTLLDNLPYMGITLE